MLLAAIIGMSACRPFEEKSLGQHDGIPDSGVLTEMIHVSYRAATDKWFGGDNAKAFRLTIQNTSTTRISGITLRVDEAFTNSLDKMLFYFGFVKGNSPLEREYLEANESIGFSFSHDASNHGIFRNDKGESLPPETLPQALEINSTIGSGKWTFK